MTSKKSYSRYFIILQEDEKGYSLDSEKLPSGYAKLEMKNGKCKVSFYVQNLKKEKGPYYMILICDKKDTKKNIKLAKMNIDDYGRIDVSHEYDMNDIAKSGIGMDKIVGASIVKLMDNNIISIMSGFATTDIPAGWKHYEMVKNENETRHISEDTIEKTIEKTTEEVKQNNNFDKYEESIEKNIKDELKHKNNDNHDNNVVRENEEKIEAENNNIKDEVQEESRNVENQCKEVVEEEEVERVNTVETEKPNEVVKEKEDNNLDYLDQPISNDMEVEYENLTRDNKDEEDYPRGRTGKFFKNIAKDFEKLPELSKEIKWCSWYKVPAMNLKNMYNMCDYNKYTVAYYPMTCYYPYINKHNHFILGYKCDCKGKMKYIVYGIPGTKDKCDQPYGGKSGFVTWIPCKDKKSMGYWLMFYDFMNSTVVVPVKK